MNTNHAEFPKYLLKFNGRRRQFLSLHESAIALEARHVSIKFGRYVLTADFQVRPLTRSDIKDVMEAVSIYRNRYVTGMAIHCK